MRSMKIKLPLSLNWILDSKLEIPPFGLWVSHLPFYIEFEFHLFKCHGFVCSLLCLLTSASHWSTYRLAHAAAGTCINSNLELSLCWDCAARGFHSARHGSCALFHLLPFFLSFFRLRIHGTCDRWNIWILRRTSDVMTVNIHMTLEYRHGGKISHSIMIWQ